jgi:hypothetical protein
VEWSISPLSFFARTLSFMLLAKFLAAKVQKTKFRQTSANVWAYI